MSGEEVEEVVAILMCREHPDCMRVRPSVGDGGIDLLLPLADGTYHVFQVKKFTETLSAKQRGQVSKSLARLVAYAKRRKLRVSAWTLVMPLDPTKENFFDWLQGQPAPPGVRPTWRGLNYVDGLAAEFPAVIDYYLSGGRDRVDVAAAEFMKLLRLYTPSGAGSRPLDASDAADTLRALANRINEQDPHYRYDLMITHEEVTVASVNPHLMVVFLQEQFPDSWVTIVVRARFEDAPAVRPVPLSVTINVEPGGELERQIREFHDYGGELVLPGANADITMDLPGGLTPEGGTTDAIRISSTHTPAPFPAEIEIVVLSPDGTELGSTVAEVTSSTTGMSGRGGRYYGQEANGLFDITLQINRETSGFRFALKSRDLDGLQPQKLRAGAEMLGHLGAPNTLLLRNPHGGQVVAQTPITEPLPDNPGLLLDVIEALLVIQRAAARPIRMPALDHFHTVKPWLDAAHLLRGGELTVRWDHVRCAPDDWLGRAIAETEGDEVGPVAFLLPLQVEIGGLSVALGNMHYAVPSARVAKRPDEDGQYYVVVPTDDPVATVTLHTPAPSPEQP